MKPRYYQEDSVRSVLKWFREGKDKPLIVLPTGTGKSVVASMICKYLLHKHPIKILVVTHVKELVNQNFNKFTNIYSDAQSGIVSSGLKRKDYHCDVVFTGIQTVYKNAHKFGFVDIVIIDEAHCIPKKGLGMWLRFLSDLRAINPLLREVGMTATPFRNDTGLLVGGQNPQFNGICYEYKITQAIKDGYLCDVVTSPVATHLSTKGVKKNKADFIESELQKAIGTDELTKSCCDEILEIGKDRKAWLIFSSGNEHANKIHEYLKSKGKSGYCITTDDLSDRDKAVYELENGLCDYIVNNMIFTTGFDCPRLDLIACLRPTQSAGLWIQICGRGTRLFEGKENCLLLDFGKNIERHGPIDKISGSEWFEKEKTGEAPQKICPSCLARVHASVTTCYECGHIFPKNDPSITKLASTGAVMSHQKEKPFDIEVIDMKVSRHKGGLGKPDSMLVKYHTLMGDIKEFVFYDHPEQSYPYQNAVKWGGAFLSVEDALKHNWKKPDSITAVKEGKYYKILKKHFTT